jgi:hypothetical protein
MHVLLYDTIRSGRYELKNKKKRKENINEIRLTLGSLPAWFMNKVSKVFVPKVNFILRSRIERFSFVLVNEKIS